MLSMRLISFKYVMFLSQKKCDFLLAGPIQNGHGSLRTITIFKMLIAVHSLLLYEV